MDLKTEIIEKVKRLAGNNFLYLDTALVVKETPHTIPVNVWAVCVGPDDEIYLMDADEQWERLEETDDNYQLVLSTVCQRVKFIYKQYQRA